MCTNQSTRKKEQIRVEYKKTSTGQSLITGVKYGMEWNSERTQLQLTCVAGAANC